MQLGMKADACTGCEQGLSVDLNLTPLDNLTRQNYLFSYSLI